MYTLFKQFFAFLLLHFLCLNAAVTPGIDQLFSDPYVKLIKGKRVGLITNHTGISSKGISTIHLFKDAESKGFCKLAALFCPEHGIDGTSLAEHAIEDTTDRDGTPIFSLHGKTRRPTKEMLSHVDVLVLDLQSTGCRVYTYEATMAYAMEEAAKLKIPFIVADRPNPINGLVVNGPLLLEKQWRSFISYINVPYCHGMTMGELAVFHNKEEEIGCNLTIVPMKGWKREMSFRDTNLSWIPTSPHIPSPETTISYPITGIVGELGLLSIGVGYTLPFQVFGAPWLETDKFLQTFKRYLLPNTSLIPFFFVPFYGLYKDSLCKGFIVIIGNSQVYQPVTIAYSLLSVLKTLYPQKVIAAFEQKTRQERMAKANGTDRVRQILLEEGDPFPKLQSLLNSKEFTQFLEKRKSYLLY